MKSVIFDFVAFRRHSLQPFRLAGNAVADAKKSGEDFSLRQQRQQRRRVFRIRAVVKRERDNFPFCRHGTNVFAEHLPLRERHAQSDAQTGQRAERREPPKTCRTAGENENQRRRAQRDDDNHLVSGQARTQHIPFVPVGEKVNSTTVRPAPGKAVLSTAQNSGAISPRTKPTAVRNPKADAE